MEKNAMKLFKDFPHVKSIARAEVSKKRKYGSVDEIDDLFNYLSSKEDDETHCFGYRKLARKYPSKRRQPVFFKTLPDDGSPEYMSLVNNLLQYGLTFNDFYSQNDKVKDQ
jgi:hypothetical protein